MLDNHGDLPCLHRPAWVDTMCQPCTVPASHPLEPLQCHFSSISSHCLSTYVHLKSNIIFSGGKAATVFKQSWHHALVLCNNMQQFLFWWKLALMLVKKQRIAPVWNWECSILIRANTWARNYENKKRIPKNGEITCTRQGCETNKGLATLNKVTEVRYTGSK